MVNKDNLGKIAEKMKDILEEIKGYGIVEYGASLLEFGLPQYTIFIETVKQLGGMADQIKLNCIIKGLSEGKNVETRMNELYTYVKNNKEHAFLVSDSFRKMMLSNSTIACCIMGIMLGDFAAENRNPTQYEAIIMRALSTFNDYDIIYFNEIMHNRYIVEIENGTKYVDCSKFPDDKKEEFMLTLDFCNNNRIFKFGTIYNDSCVIADVSTVDKVSEVLLKYINRARTQMSYEIHAKEEKNKNF